MTTTTQTDLIANTNTDHSTNAPYFLRLLNWVAEWDRQYREKQALRNLPYERLVDMGITKEEAKG